MARVRIVLELNHDPEREAPPALWDWETLLDPLQLDKPDVRVILVEDVHEKVKTLPGQTDFFEEQS